MSEYNSEKPISELSKALLDLNARLSVQQAAISVLVTKNLSESDKELIRKIIIGSDSYQLEASKFTGTDKLLRDKILEHLDTYFPDE
ncbi:TPA: hypothetical protein KEY68_000171 [Providencia rettgeri]|nr:hypothetical protein [Providencia rettgeri]